MSAEHQTTLQTGVKLTTHDRDILHLIFNPNESYDVINDENNSQEDAEEETTESMEARRLELAGVRAAEAGDAGEALRLFTEVIHLIPDRPSGYNNRAQAHRLNNDIIRAEADLDKAIALSHGRGQAACQAYTQRGLLRRRRDDVSGATEDFENASRLGGCFAKSQLVALNPYAQMCGAMVAEMLKLERRGAQCGVDT